MALATWDDFQKVELFPEPHSVKDNRRALVPELCSFSRGIRGILSEVHPNSAACAS